MSTIAVKAGPLGNMSDLIVLAGSTLKAVTDMLVAKGVSGIAGKQPYVNGAMVAKDADPVILDGQMVMYNGELKGN